MAITNATLKDRTPRLQLLAIGLDLFGQGIDNIDQDKLHNIATCEINRLHRFANEFPFEQHLLNLQSILVSLLANLARKVADNTTSVNEFRRELSRIVVLIIEIDAAVAKAKRRKQFEFTHSHGAIKEAELAIKLAADKDKDSDEDHKAKKNELRLRHIQEEKFIKKIEKLLTQAETLAQHVRLIKTRSLEATHTLLPHYRLKSLSLRLDEKMKLMQAIEAELKVIIHKMRITDHGTEREILTTTLKNYRLTPK